MTTIKEVIKEHEKEHPLLSVKPLEDDLILIEGDKMSLLFLSKLIQAVAESDDKIQIGPHYAGNRYFHESSQFGLYINRQESTILDLK
ncbi:MAG: hypothetical protein KA436_04820 [Oligoflexales bacterium]|nr:hypothetical protein [Oligoflexales bacterium]